VGLGLQRQRAPELKRQGQRPQGQRPQGHPPQRQHPQRQRPRGRMLLLRLQELLRRQVWALWQHQQGQNQPAWTLWQPLGMQGPQKLLHLQELRGLQRLLILQMLQGRQNLQGLQELQ